MSFSISEIILILIIALLVIKPDELPRAAFNMGRLAQFVRHLFSKLKNEMNEVLDPAEKSGQKRER